MVKLYPWLLALFVRRLSIQEILRPYRGQDESRIIDHMRKYGPILRTVQADSSHLFVTLRVVIFQWTMDSLKGTVVLFTSHTSTGMSKDVGLSVKSEAAASKLFKVNA